MMTEIYWKISWNFLIKNRNRTGILFVEGEYMYKKLKDNESFSDTYATWIIAYCLDTDSFFATNQRHFYWEYNDEFQCENDAINYFRNHLKEFWDVRKDILSHTGGWSIDRDLFLENTKERFRIYG